jgi:exodeoxyribonuclease V alpha subunit
MTLSTLLEEGILSSVDLYFAKSVLKQWKGGTESQALFLAVLFAHSRQGHLALNLAALNEELEALGMTNPDLFAELIRTGAATLPPAAIAQSPSGHPPVFVCRENTHYYLQKNWVYETQILYHLRRLHASKPRIDLSYSTDNSRLNAEQKKAVEDGLSHSLSFLTGGPGTGKTFTAVELIKTCLSSLPENQRADFHILLAAPTGKAIAHLEGNLRKGLDGAVSLRAGTLHALLGIRASGTDEEIPPLLADLILVDECSMIDAKIFARLLSAVADGSRLILIGDKDQLPPVDAGSIFADLIDLDTFPTTHLATSLRSDRQEILAVAQAIREGKSEEALAWLKHHPGMHWEPLDTPPLKPDAYCKKLWESHYEKIPADFACKPSAEELLAKIGRFSLLSCMRQGPLGVDAINRYFLHQSLRKIQVGHYWAAPILITRNDADLQLYNGDLGFVVRKVDADFSLGQFALEDYALFPDRAGGCREIAALALNGFEYSYCLSVHKSQGSEYDEIVILAPDGSESFGREVLYTAVTRAKLKMGIAASESLLQSAIRISSRKRSGLILRESVHSKALTSLRKDAGGTGSISFS